MCDRIDSLVDLVAKQSCALSDRFYKAIKLNCRSAGQLGYEG